MSVVMTLVASGVAIAVVKIGTEGNDTLRGTNGPDTLIGNGGNDALLAFGGADTLLGGEGSDGVLGGSLTRPFGGPKTLSGGPGNDQVLGGTGTDTVIGGMGNDILADGAPREFSHDTLQGLRGRDDLNAANDPAFGDLVQCGEGFDRAFLDPKDVAQGCERKQVIRDIP
jgi:Ca2+-binding RTX toxin-like protein